MNPWVEARRILPLDGARIVTVGLISGTKILTGQRKDNGKWTSPGGHMDEGETLLEAACRETREEASIEVDPENLQLISAERCISNKTGKDFSVFAFIARVPKEKATNKNDPDDEISQWKWVEMSPESIELHPGNRHAQHDSVLCHLGICRAHGRLRSKDLTSRRLAMFSDEYTESIGPIKKEIQQGQASENQAIDNIARTSKK